MPSRCRFNEFQKTYFNKLVELKFVVIDLEAGLGAEEVEEDGEGEAQSKCTAKAEKNNMEAKMDAMLFLLKMLIVVLFVGGIAALMK
jgi:cytochrome c-type biogenesis protein CcmH/NrfG